MDALTGDELTALRTGYATAQYLTLCPNTVLWKTRVSIEPTGTSYASLSWSVTISGNRGDVELGHTIVVSDVDDISSPKWVGRIRKLPDASTIYINETSADIDVNDYIWVIDDYRIWERLSRESGGVRLIDWDITFAAAGSGLPPFVYDLQSAYAGWVDDTSNKLRINFSVLAAAAESGATISSYNWTFPTGSGSVTGGSVASNIVQYDFNPGFWWVELRVADNAGRTLTRRIAVAAHSDAFLPELGFTGASIDGSADNGWSTTIEAFDGVDDVLDNTLAIIWRGPTYYGTPSATTEREIYNNVEMIGRFRQQDQITDTIPDASINSIVNYQIEGAALQLARTTSPLIRMRHAEGGSTSWDVIEDLTPWRALVNVLANYSTFLTLHSLEFEDFLDTYEVKALETKEQNLWDCAKEILSSILWRFETKYEGSAYAFADARYLSNANRAGLTTVATFTNEDWYNITIDHEHVNTIGQLIGFGATYDTSSGNVTPVASLSPGTAQGSAPSKSQLSDQILEADAIEDDAQNELNNRIGYHFEAINPTDILEVQHPDGYHLFTPTYSQYFKWTIDDTDTIGSQTFTSSTRWFLIAINHSHDNITGTRQVNATYAQETFGDPAQTYKPPSAGEVDYALPNMPNFNPYGASMPLLPFWNTDYTPPYFGLSRNPELYDTILQDGNTVIAWGWETGTVTSSILLLSRNFLNSNPSWREITPAGASNHQIKYAAFKDPLNRQEAYCLSYDGSSDSYFWYTENIFASEIEWESTILSGVEWDYIRVAENGLYIVQSSGTTTDFSYSDPLTSGLGAQSYVPPHFGYSGFRGITPCGTWISTNGRTGGGSVRGDNIGAVPGSFGSQIIEGNVVVDLGAEYTITYAKFWYKHSDNNKLRAARIFVYDNALNFTSLFDDLAATSSTSYDSAEWRGVQENVRLVVFNADAARIADGGAGTPYLDDVEVEYVTLSGTAGTRYSTDDGSSFATEQSLGLSGTSFIGADPIKIGDPIIAGSAYQSKIATVAGGAYSDETNHPTAAYPACIVVPFWQLGGATTKNIDTTSPDYFIMSNLTDPDDDTLWKIDASAGTTTAITPDTDAVAVGPQCVSVSQWSSNYIAVLATQVLQNKLFVSSDGGSTWSAGTALGTPAPHIRMRKGDRRIRQLFIATASGPVYSSDFGTTVITKDWPGPGLIRGIEVYG